MFLLRGYIVFEQTDDNVYHITINGTKVGVTNEMEHVEELLIEARKRIASESDELIFIEPDIQLEGEKVLFGKMDDDEILVERMENSLRDAIVETTERAYTLKVNQYLVNLQSADEVRTLLQAAIDKYDSEQNFKVQLVHDPGQEFNMLGASVKGLSERKAAEEEEKSITRYGEGGVSTMLAKMGQNMKAGTEKEFSDFELGILDMGFAEKVEIVESYLPQSQLTDLDVAIEEVIKEQEKPSEYTIVEGDTLSEISIAVNIPIDKIVAMNASLEDENTPIHVGDKLVITVPEPELSVRRIEQNYYEEVYDADVIYVDEDSWYTTQTEVLRQPSAGFRKVVADVTYLNDKEVSREILKEEIVMDAVAKIVKRGTKIPPTYVKPISGGRFSSGFGRRSRPTRGASRYHKGVDWAVPTGTSVYASSGGTVAKAGWGRGYGYVVYINHADGRQTRYAHLSKVLVKPGQAVKQGDVIARSGNTGVSSGPHLHFEILINGSQVNPLKYLNK